VAASDDAVPEELRVISALPAPGGAQYRVVGPEPRGALGDVEPRPPTLEDGYVWLLHRARRDAGAAGAERSSMPAPEQV